MKRMSIDLVTVATVVILAMVPTHPSVAQSAMFGSLPAKSIAATSAIHQARGMTVDSFGTNTQWSVFRASRWIPTNQTPIPKAYMDGELGPTDTNLSVYWTQVDLPCGASIDFMYALVYDADTQENWLFGLQVEEGGTNGVAPSMAFSSAAFSSGAPGYTVVELYVVDPIIVRRIADLDGDGLATPVAYTLYLNGTQADGTDTLRFWGAVVQWHRTVSPAPASATFGDVPTDHWAFPFVEALAASGITAGCGGGDYCPDDPVTRAQMAVYLSAALGLHWPY